MVTVRNFENERSTPQRASLEVMRRAFEEAGVAFIAEKWRRAGRQAEAGVKAQSKLGQPWPGYGK